IQARQHDVEENQIGSGCAPQLQRSNTVVGALGTEALAAQVLLEDLGQSALVFDHQDHAAHMFTLHRKAGTGHNPVPAYRRQHGARASRFQGSPQRVELFDTDLAAGESQPGDPQRAVSAVAGLSPGDATVRSSLRQSGTQLLVLLSGDLAPGQAQVGVFLGLITQLMTARAVVLVPRPASALATASPCGEASLTTVPVTAPVAAAVRGPVTTPWTTGARAAVAACSADEELDRHHHHDEEQDQTYEVEEHQTEWEIAEHTCPFLEP